MRETAAERGGTWRQPFPKMRETSRQFEALGGEIYHESLPDEA